MLLNVFSNQLPGGDGIRLRKVNNWFTCDYEGCTRHPCKQIKYSQRVAVRPIRS